MKHLNLNFRIGHALFALVVGILVIAGGIWFAHWLHFRLTHVLSDDARVNGEVITLSSRLPGWITSLPVIEGDTIKAGQVVARIDNRDTVLKRAALAAQLQSTLLQRHSQEAQLSQTNMTTQGDLAASQGKLESALAARTSVEHHLQQVRADYKRTEDLAARHFLSPQALDLAHTTLEQTEAQLRQADGDISAARGTLASAQGQRGQLPVLQAKLQANNADADQIRAQIAALDAELSDREIKSPVNGHVVMTFARNNEYVLAGQRVLMVHDPIDQWVEANIKETDVALVKLGAKVEIRSSAYPDQLLHGTVVRIGGAATSQFALLPDPNPSGNFTKVTQRLPVRIAFDSPAPSLHPGMMVEVAIEHGSR